MPVKKAADFTEQELAAVARFLVRQPPSHAFDDFGLHFPLEWLNKVKTTIILLPLELMAEYVDAVTFEAIACKIDLHDWKSHLDDGPHREGFMASLNATTIGNLAHIALYSSDLELQEKCLSFLNLVYDKHRLEILRTFN